MPANTIGVAQLAKLLDVTPRQIQKLTAEDVLHRASDADGKELRGRYPLLAVREYCRYLRGQARLEDASESQNAALKNRKLGAEAEMSELKLRQFKGQLHHAADVEFSMTNLVTHFRQGILAIPTRVARQCEGKTFKDILTILTDEIHSVMNKLSGYDPSQFKQQEEDFLESKGVSKPGEVGKEQ